MHPSVCPGVDRASIQRSPKLTHNGDERGELRKDLAVWCFRGWVWSASEYVCVGGGGGETRDWGTAGALLIEPV